ncbi:MAG: hypothetical protein K8L97_19170 [Anaerolineae bacterium]|nr:hypothetical protein [Anaerolineae bacterium]
MKSKSEDMEVTTMRVTKRTAKYVEYLKGLLKVRNGRDYSPDDVVWEAITATFGTDIAYADQTTSSNKSVEE